MARRRREAVEQILDIIGAEVAAMPEPHLAAVLPALAEAQQELIQDLKSWLKRVDGAETYTAQMHRRALIQIRGALAKAQALRPTVYQALLGGSRVVGVDAVRHVLDMFERMSLMFEGTVTTIPLDVAATVAHGDRMMIPRFRAAAARYSGYVLDDIKQQLAVGIVKGETIFEMTARLARLGGPRGMVALRGVAGEPGSLVQFIGEGLFRRYRSRAERLVRTEIIAAYNVHAAKSIADVHAIDPGIKQRWDAAADRRVCEPCYRLDGKTAPVGGLFDGRLEHPPAHPNCRCALVAWHDSWDEERKARRPEAPVSVL